MSEIRLEFTDKVVKLLRFSSSFGKTVNLLLDKLKQKGISISSMGQGKLRIVTHLDYREVMHNYVLETLEKMDF